MKRRTYEVTATKDTDAASSDGNLTGHRGDRAPMSLTRRRQGPLKSCRRCASLMEACAQCRVDTRRLNGLEPNEGDLRAARAARVVPYRLTVDRYEAMMLEQAGSCAICGHTPPWPDDLFIDHNHTTGDVRGLLCGSCNSALGQFQDSPVVLDRAKTYLIERGFYGKVNE